MRLTTSITVNTGNQVMDDGGSIALSGFVFQLLGSAAEAFRIVRPPVANDAELEVMLVLESYGQDSLLSAGAESALSQFKYSALAAAIQPSELYEICIKLHQSITIAQENGWTGLRPQIVTNRDLSPVAKAMVAAAAAGNAHIELDRVERRVGHGKKARIEYKGRNADSNAQFKAILRSLRHVLLQQQEIHAVLNDRCAKFGMSETEAVDAAYRLCGLMVRQATEYPRRVSLAEMDAALTSDASPRLLRSKENKRAMEQHLKDFKDQNFKHPQTIQRKALCEQIMMADEALVVIEGRGGYGKSIASLLVLEEYVRLHDLPPPFVAFGYANTIERDWLQRRFQSWRASDQYLGESISDVVNRLRRTCSDSPYPYLVCTVDGLDECRSRDSEHIQSLFAVFHTRAPPK